MKIVTETIGNETKFKFRFTDQKDFNKYIDGLISNIPSETGSDAKKKFTRRMNAFANRLTTREGEYRLEAYMSADEMAVFVMSTTSRDTRLLEEL